MASPPRQDVKTFLLSSSVSSTQVSEATTSAIIRPSDARHICPIGSMPFSEMNPPIPLPLATPTPPLHTTPMQHEHRHKRRHLLMGPPAPPVSSSSRPAFMSGGLDSGHPLLTPPAAGSLSGMPRFPVSSPKDVKSTAENHITDDKEIAAAAQLYHYYLEPSARLLAQNRLVYMGGLRPGLYDGKVGLLAGLHGNFMEKYEVRVSCDLHRAPTGHQWRFLYFILLFDSYRNHPRGNGPPARIYHHIRPRKKSNYARRVLASTALLAGNGKRPLKLSSSWTWATCAASA